MNIIQLTPGTGGMYCGNCFRDNALVAELRSLGHDALMVPLYLPLKLDEADLSAGTPIFFGGINVYLEQKIPAFRFAPVWLRNLLSSPRLLARAAGHSAKTRAEDVGEIMISMLQGEQGRQARELEDLVRWLQSRPMPDAVCLSNAFLLGMARTIKRQLSTRIVCYLQGEDSYLDSLTEEYREHAWELLRERAADADLFIAPNRYFADVMTERMQLAPERVRVIGDGINLEGYAERAVGEDKAGEGKSTSPILGYFARMCPEKGLDRVIDAFIELRGRGSLPDLRLKIGGGCGPGDEAFVAELKARLERARLGDAVTWHPNLDRQEKIRFLQTLTVFSVPAAYPEAFGMYLAEALAAGIPVVQPDVASFPDFVKTTGGGLVYDPSDPGGLPDALEKLLTDPARAASLGEAGQAVVQERFSAKRMAQDVAATLGSL